MPSRKLVYRTLCCVQWLAVTGLLGACGGGAGSSDAGGSLTTDVGAAGPQATASAAADNPGAGPAGGTLVLRIGGTQPGVDHDVLAVAGNAELAGTLSLQFADGYVPPAGQRFAVIRAGSFTGAFANVTSSPPRTLATSRDTTNFYVTVSP